MPGPNRTAKARARRIDRSYFLRSFPIPRWRWILALSLVAVVVGWLGIHFARGSDQPYAGPLTHPHALLNQKCDVCHVRTAAFSSKVTNNACSSCHSAAVHHPNQVFTPNCADCHVEHTANSLIAVPDAQCVRCHSELRVQSGSLKVAAHVRSFTSDHPEFTLPRDVATIRFNHAAHLKKEMRSNTGNITLRCTDCHRSEPPSSPKYMDPVNYSQHCASCHPLTFDRRFGEPVPHKAPEVVHDFLVQKFTAWITAHPEELRNGSADIRIPRPPAVPGPRTAADWIALRVSEAEFLLRSKTCAECHRLAPANSGIPPIAPAKLTTRWFTHSQFDHSAHQLLNCESCHKQARESTKTSDVLLPNIAVCRTCHVSGSTNAAGASCVECHVYHDPLGRKPVEGKFTLDQISAVR